MPPSIKCTKCFKRLFKPVYCETCDKPFHTQCLPFPESKTCLQCTKANSESSSSSSSSGEEVEEIQEEVLSVYEYDSDSQVYDDLPDMSDSSSEDEKLLIEKILYFRESSKSNCKKPKFEYYCKYEGYSYLHCKWLSANEVSSLSKAKLSNFHKRVGYDPNNQEAEGTFGVLNDWKTVDRIIKIDTSDDVAEYLIKWVGLSYEECSWEVEELYLELGGDAQILKKAIENYYKYERQVWENGVKREKSRISESRLPIKNSEPFFQGSLFPYQVEGVNWILKSFLNNQNVILADEMGLGKTIQCMTFLSSLSLLNINGPHLIIAPLSTLFNWENEIKKWTPQFYHVIFSGSQASRNYIKENDWFVNEKPPSNIGSKISHVVERFGFGRKKPIKFNILLCAYDTITGNPSIFKKIKWKSIIVDEAHRLKNNESKFFKVLSSFSSDFSLLLTGTPLQNSLDELFNLLHFLDPKSFDPGCFETERLRGAAAEATSSSTKSRQNQSNLIEETEDEVVKMESGSESEKEGDSNQIVDDSNQIVDDSNQIVDDSNQIVDDSNPSVDEELALARMKFTTDQLRHRISGLILRRTKADVMIDIPSKIERLVYVDLTPWQKYIYKIILTKNYSALTSAIEAGRASLGKNSTGNRASLSNIAMQLLKVCDHPFLVDPDLNLENGSENEGESEKDERENETEEQLKRIVQASGKLLMLDKILSSLLTVPEINQKATSRHRILIFSQLVMMLDVISDFLNLKGISFERIDGSTDKSERQRSLDRFNSPSSTTDVFLLSTLAGGLGVNLATADTVVLFDSQWNPHNDLQALARAHRIGQTKTVLVLRLVTANSVEERILEVGRKKLALETVVEAAHSKGKQAPKLTAKDFDDALRHGAADIFGATSFADTTRRNYASIMEDLKSSFSDFAFVHPCFNGQPYSTQQFNQIFDREVSKITSSQGGVDGFILDPNSAVVNTDSKPKSSDVLFWDDLLKDSHEKLVEKEGQKFGKGMRRQARQIDYTIAVVDSVSEYDSESASDFELDYLEVLDEYPELIEELDDIFSLGTSIDPVSEDNDDLLYGLTDKDRNLVHSYVGKFGFTPENTEVLVENVCNFVGSKTATQAHVSAYIKAISRYILSYSAFKSRDLEPWMFSYFPDGVSVALFEPKMIAELEERVLFMSTANAVLQGLFKLKGQIKLNPFPGNVEFIWNLDTDDVLLRGLLLHGYSKWAEISRTCYKDVTLADFLVSAYTESLSGTSEEEKTQKLANFGTKISIWVKKRLYFLIEFFDVFILNEKIDAEFQREQQQLLAESVSQVQAPKPPVPRVISPVKSLEKTTEIPVQTPPIVIKVEKFEQKIEKREQTVEKKEHKVEKFEQKIEKKVKQEMETMVKHNEEVVSSPIKVKRELPSMFLELISSPDPFDSTFDSDSNISSEISTERNIERLIEQSNTTTKKSLDEIKPVTPQPLVSKVVLKSPPLDSVKITQPRISQFMSPSRKPTSPTPENKHTSPVRKQQGGPPKKKVCKPNYDEVVDISD
ncbi:hypothetical protein RCL1_005385 [Eukaryota sp. TZLM3-RCL]